MPETDTQDQATDQPPIDTIIADKQAELKAIHKCEIGVLQFRDPETKEDVIGYYRVPDRMQKLSLADRAYAAAGMSSASLVFDACFIPEASDSRILAEDSFYMGACKQIIDLATYAVNFYKKK